jgi:uridine kinase
MRGDKLIIEPHHREAATNLASLLERRLSDRGDAPLIVSIGGESGSGKSELAAALADELRARDVPALVIQQDDYFIHPPKTNERKRREEIGWVGPQEVRLDLLDANLKALIDGAEAIVKPLVFYDEDRIGEERLSAEGARVVVVEGTYTSLLRNVDVRVFIDRTFRDSRGARTERARETQDAFLDRVLEIEHGIISRHRDHADILIGADYSVKELVRKT